MIYNSKMEAQNYFPPMLGNGDMTFSVDPEGGINHGGNDFGNVQGFDGVIYRAGRRLAPNYKNKSDIKDKVAAIVETYTIDRGEDNNGK